jgi:hypothetical protein
MQGNTSEITYKRLSSTTVTTALVLNTQLVHQSIIVVHTGLTVCQGYIPEKAVQIVHKIPI